MEDDGCTLRYLGELVYKWLSNVVAKAGAYLMDQEAQLSTPFLPLPA